MRCLDNGHESGVATRRMAAKSDDACRKRARTVCNVDLPTFFRSIPLVSFTFAYGIERKLFCLSYCTAWAVEFGKRPQGMPIFGAVSRRVGGERKARDAEIRCF